jgi:hypothetical protein
MPRASEQRPSTDNFFASLGNKSPTPPMLVIEIRAVNGRDFAEHSILRPRRGEQSRDCFGVFGLIWTDHA